MGSELLYECCKTYYPCMVKVSALCCDFKNSGPGRGLFVLCAAETDPGSAVGGANHSGSYRQRCFTRIGYTFFSFSPPNHLVNLSYHFVYDKHRFTESTSIEWGINWMGWDDFKINVRCIKVWLCPPERCGTCGSFNRRRLLASCTFYKVKLANVLAS